MVKKGEKGASELTKFLTERDWDTVFRVIERGWTDPLGDLGNAIEVDAKRTKRPLSKVAREYYLMYFFKHK
jgi:hypothetical protein